MTERSFESFMAISGPDLGHASDWCRRNFPSRETLNQLARSWYMGAFKIPKLPDLFFPSNVLALCQTNIGRKRTSRRIETRTLQIVSTRDRCVTPAMGRAAKPWCGDLTVTTVPAGHWVIRSHSELVASWITEFTLER